MFLLSTWANFTSVSSSTFSMWLLLPTRCNTACRICCKFEENYSNKSLDWLAQQGIAILNTLALRGSGWGKCLEEVGGLEFGILLNLEIQGKKERRRKYFFPCSFNSYLILFLILLLLDIYWYLFFLIWLSVLANFYGCFVYWLPSLISL